MPQQTQPDPLFLGFQLALAGRYSIDRELGRGGMGVVYLAREVHLDRLVAIKLLPPERSAIATLRDRFLREARLAAKLSHPHIIPIHAVDEVEGFVYYVMSYVDGETLAQRVRQRGPMSASDGSRVLREAAWALAYAHSQGLVHRDVKPDNILIEFSTGRALVADFGIAAAAGEAAADGISGTPEFMSPEQALGGDIDARSDLYGLGATAFYAFSGRLPFEGDSTTQILAKQVTEAPPPLASLGIAVPRKLAQLVDRCLAKDPAHRPASAEALAEQLGVAMDQRREMPVALRAFVRRNGRMDGGGTLLLGGGLLAGSIIASATIGVVGGFATFALGAALVPFAFAVRAARKLTRLGFAHADLGPAFRAEIENSREERAVEQRRGRTAIEWLLGRIARVLWTYTEIAWPVIAAFKLAGNATPAADAAVPITVLTTLGAAFYGASYLALIQLRRDVDTEFWSRTWMGKLGRSAFLIARRLQGSKQVAAAMTHRATELSLGMAAEQLFESLPKETRHALGDLPALLHRLQHDAQVLRRSYDELQDGLGRAGPSTSDDYESLRAERDLVHEKLGDAVGALETIRLNLLRLHAGSATVEGLTTHIGLAAEVSAEVERLIAAREEVEGQMRFPREIELTPVYQMARIRTDPLGAAAGYQDVVEDAALPVRRPDAGLPAQPAANPASVRGILRQTMRVLRDAGIAVALMLTVPVALVALRGDVLWRQSNFSAYVHQNIVNVGASRSFGVPADASISPIDAGRAFAALQPVKPQPGFIPNAPAVRAGPSWRDAQLTPAMFPGARPDLYRGTSYLTILREATKPLSAAEMEYLRTVASGWEWRGFDVVARAPKVDILGGQLQLPFAENAYPEMRPVQFREIRELSYAAVSRAAYHLAIGQRDSAETILRSIVSVGFAMIDNGSSPLDEMIGSSIVGIGRDGLRQFYEMTKDPRAASPALAKPPKMETPAYRFRAPTRTPEETRARLIATVGDRRIPMGERFESLELLSRSSCTNVRELLFGPKEDAQRALDGARASLGRFPSEQALVGIIERLAQPSLDDVGSNPVTMMATSAATVPGAVLRNPRLAACTRMLSSW